MNIKVFAGFLWVRVEKSGLFLLIWRLVFRLQRKERIWCKWITEILSSSNLLCRVNWILRFLLVSKTLRHRRFSQVTMEAVVNIVIFPCQIFNVADCIEGILSLLSLWLYVQRCFSSTNQYSCYNSKALGWGHTLHVQLWPAYCAAEIWIFYTCNPSDDVDAAVNFRIKHYASYNMNSAFHSIISNRSAWRQHLRSAFLMCCLNLLTQHRCFLQSLIWNADVNH